MLRNIWKPLGLRIILMVLMVLLPVSVMAAPVGKISHLEGEADVTTPDGKTAIVKLTDPVSVGDILRTKTKSKVEVTFLDGNTVFLAERSRLKISEYEHKEESKSYFDLFRGKTRVVVNNLANKSALELHTPTAVAGVRGTIWIGSYENGVSEFYFVQGEGYGYSVQRPLEVVTIKAGQAMTVLRPDQSPVVRPASAYEIERLQMETTASKVLEQPKDASTLLTASGTLTPSGLDKGKAGFLAQPATTGSNNYGTFTVDATGAWTYTADKSQSAIQQLAMSGTLTDSFVVTGRDGSQQVITVTITGAIGGATIGGVTVAGVTAGEYQPLPPPPLLPLLPPPLPVPPPPPPLPPPPPPPPPPTTTNVNIDVIFP